MQKMSLQQARNVNGGFSFKSLFNPVSSFSQMTNIGKAITSVGVSLAQRLGRVA